MTTAESGTAAARTALSVVLKRGFFFILAALTIATLYTHEAYVFDRADPEWAHLKPMRWWLVPHVACAAFALLSGPLQFSQSIRRWSLPFHRWLGRAYACAAIVASLLSVYIVLKFEAPYNRWSMGTMGGLWFLTTVFAWLAARNRDLAQHRLWVGRSYALTFTFVTTRFLPDIVFPGLDYFNMTALYWLLIVLALLLPDLLISGRAVLPWAQPARKRPGF